MPTNADKAEMHRRALETRGMNIRLASMPKQTAPTALSSWRKWRTALTLTDAEIDALLEEEAE